MCMVCLLTVRTFQQGAPSWVFFGFVREAFGSSQPGWLVDE